MMKKVMKITSDNEFVTKKMQEKMKKKLRIFGRLK
jgi:hypothetical protein